MTNLKRNAGNTQLQTGEYLPAKAATHWCIWKCPACGTLANITKRWHSVTHFGEITPAVRCPNNQCYHEDSYWLDDWIPEAKGQA